MKQSPIEMETAHLHSPAPAPGASVVGQSVLLSVT